MEIKPLPETQPDMDYASYRQAAIDSQHKAREKTASMSPAEYAAFTGGMSFPAGVEAEMQRQAEVVACEAADADYVRAFMKALEDPDIRLTTEKPHDWTNWGVKAKAAILAALKRSEIK